MEFEKIFTKYYKKVCLDVKSEQIDSRLDGINEVIEWCDSLEKIISVVKLYFKMQCEGTIREEFINCFYTLDKTFDEENSEEIAILAGCTLIKMIQESEYIEIAYLLEILDQFYENEIHEMKSIADELISIKTKVDNEKKECKFIAWNKNWKEELEEKGSDLSTAPEAYTDIFRKIKTQLAETIKYSKFLMEKNMRCEQKIGVLSWIVGEWSDLMKLPICNIEDVVGALIVGVELADLVDMPGVYAAEAFLHKMLGKCQKTKEKVSLTDFVDSQDESVRKLVSEKYGDGAIQKCLPVLSAINASLTVEEKKAWIPAYKKAWKISPDEVNLPLIEWSKLVYFECLVSKY